MINNNICKVPRLDPVSKRALSSIFKSYHIMLGLMNSKERILNDLRFYNKPASVVYLCRRWKHAYDDLFLDRQRFSVPKLHSYL